MARTKEDWEASATAVLKEADDAEYKGRQWVEAGNAQIKRAEELRAAGNAIIEMAETMARS